MLYNKLKEEKLFAKNYKEKVDTTKVKLEVFRPWVEKKIKELLGIEDDIITEYAFAQLSEKKAICSDFQSVSRIVFGY